MEWVILAIFVIPIPLWGRGIKMNTFREDVIPQGNSSDEIKCRKKMIEDYYRQWQVDNPSKRVYNRNLRDYINVRQISVIETAEHASKRYLSTLAVLQLDAILACARKVAVSRPKKNSNQSEFKAMIEMRHHCPGIGAVKLTVGIRMKSAMKIQYCITALGVMEN